MATDYTNLPTPSFVYVDFCLVPLGTGNPSVAEEVAEVQRVLNASKLSYTLHSAGTTVEGPWDDVMRAIGQAHEALLQRGIVRIQTSMRVGARTDKVQHWKEKIDRVENLLAKDSKESK
ncbi:hypothetical protein SODALDRAFT_334101 [Sodiomyces alkalinus F11]|uniref:Thiamine-binding protein domain-containing protein n=1 Tax=Sodiomyces alkalinus (strain CBS 110278 / VKM F-3762 / F11) TaxID=1314773 RepID=A0A3N2PV17_SODAK|nr:hypothetical protein SODALDRAFT_334101 [Sodiomyces alkalinus F11]ROT38335.1 hypothetical protein SODALDRAFT_334101 [Sodiomyces alkalinus F11]